MSGLKRVVENTIPVLRVSDLKRSLDFYTNTLDFKVDWGDDEGRIIASVSKDGCPIMLSQFSTIGTPGWVWIGVEDDSRFHLYRARGVTVVQEPQNHSWAYEMKFADPDGNVLWLGTEPRTDLPLED